MKNKSASQSAFFYFRTSLGLLFVVTGVLLAVLSLGQFSARAQRSNTASAGISPLVPPGFDCASIAALGIDKQENLRAGAIMIACGLAEGGSIDPDAPAASLTHQIIADISAPFLGGADKNLITPGPESGTHITQSETYALANPNNPNEIVVAYNDSRGVFASPINISGMSVSTDGGATFIRLTKTNGQSPFTNTFGDPVVLYSSTIDTFFGVFLDAACGGQGIGYYKSTNPIDPNSWTHGCIHNGGSDDRESGYSDNNAGSPFNGRLYVSWNNFAVAGGALQVTFSTDNGTTWHAPITVNSAGFVRDVQITGDPNGTVYIAGMNEGGGGLTTRSNKMYRSTDGGNTWALTYTGPTFNGPGRTLCPNTYFACMFTGPSFWRHMGWGQPAALNGNLHYVYDARNTANGDPADVFYIRSTDSGVTFSAPVKLNQDSTTKANWQPNLSIGSDNSLVAVWYDERDAAAPCVKGDETKPCYKMWARRSTDGGQTWQAEETFSDVLSPLPGQPDGGIISEYCGDYDYSNSVGATHLHPWVDGRVVVNSASQQDAFFDQSAGGGVTITLEARGRVVNGFNVASLSWDGATSVNVDVYRDGVVVATTANDGSYDDNTGTTGRQRFTYKVCEAGTQTCSNQVTVRFRGP